MSESPGIHPLNLRLFFRDLCKLRVSLMVGVSSGILTAFLITSCTDAFAPHIPPSPMRDSQPVVPAYMHFALGDTLVYSTSSGPSRVVVVDSITQFDGNGYFRFRHMLLGYGTDMWLGMDGDGNIIQLGGHEYKPIDSSATPYKTTLFEFNRHVARPVWVYTFSKQPPYSWAYELDSLNASITTQAGAFHECALVASWPGNGEGWEKVWLAPGVGIVKIEQQVGLSPGYSEELVRYSLRDNAGGGIRP